MIENKTIEDILEILEDKSIDISMVDEIYEKYKDNKNIVSQVAMNVSQRTSVYDLSVGQSDILTNLLVKLSYSEDMSVRWAVAKNHHTPSSVLDVLAEDEVNLVRALCATNPNTQVKHLEKFFHDEKIVRDGISGNPNTPIKILKILASDSDKMVRLRVVENKSCPQEILEKLVNDTEMNIQKASKIHLKERFGIETE